jgi:hypothetical protein
MFLTPQKISNWVQMGFLKVILRSGNNRSWLYQKFIFTTETFWVWEGKKGELELEKEGIVRARGRLQ